VRGVLSRGASRTSVVRARRWDVLVAVRRAGVDVGERGPRHPLAYRATDAAASPLARRSISQRRVVARAGTQPRVERRRSIYGVAGESAARALLCAGARHVDVRVAPATSLAAAAAR